MRRMMLAGAVTGAALVGYGTAMAQVVIEAPPADVYVGTPYAYDSGHYATRRGARVYGYAREYRDDDYAIAVRPNGPGGCGTYYYWNGERCVDARR